MTEVNAEAPSAVVSDVAKPEKQAANNKSEFKDEKKMDETPKKRGIKKFFSRMRSGCKDDARELRKQKVIEYGKRQAAMGNVPEKEEADVKPEEAKKPTGEANSTADTLKEEEESVKPEEEKKIPENEKSKEDAPTLEEAKEEEQTKEESAEEPKQESEDAPTQEEPKEMEEPEQKKDEADLKHEDIEEKGDPTRENDEKGEDESKQRNSAPKAVGTTKPMTMQEEITGWACCAF